MGMDEKSVAIDEARFSVLMDKLEELVAQNTGLSQEISGLRIDIVNLKEYVTQLETKAQEMASPENMQKAMQSMMGSLSF